MESILDRDDYRTFTQKVQILESKGYSLPYMAEKIEDKFKVTIHGEHDIATLDKLCDD